ncbi:hypothetical protein [Cohnella massiliensis]|uniref:hypothetical protein n=1 Tax=Cohnella massiliensis TaxID=1816691 RepID=UPI0015945E84|nr:hypothetical protein [Cohnella massiliensis]
MDEEKPTIARVILLVFVVIIAGFVVWGVTSNQESGKETLRIPGYEDDRKV